MYPDARGVSLAARGPRAFTFAHASRARAALRARPAAVGATQSASGATNGQWIVFSARRTACCPNQLFRIKTDGTGCSRSRRASRTPRSRRSLAEGNEDRVRAARPRDLRHEPRRQRRAPAHARRARPFPVWSPNGKSIAFLRRCTKATFASSLMRRRRRALHRLKTAPPSGPSVVDGKQQVALRSRAGRSTSSTPAPASPEACDATARRPVRVDSHRTGARSPSSARARRSRAATRSRASSTPSTLATYSRQDARSSSTTAGPAGWSPDSKRLVFVYRGALTFWPVGGKKPSATLETGLHVAQADAPPAWQPR